MECGCCAYVCPAAIPLVQLMRMGKAQMQKEMTKS
jgi:electron transport complex protein RnfC